LSEDEESFFKQYLRVYNLKTEDLYPGEEENIRLAWKYYNTDTITFKIKKEECILTVVDLQNDFVELNSVGWIPMATRQIPKIKKLIEKCRELKVPVIYTTHTIAPDCAHLFYKFWDWIKPKELGGGGGIVEGSRGADVFSEIYPKLGERVIRTKHTFNSFEGTDLDYVLRDLRVKTVIICGTVTNVCCESTARDAFFKHYQVVFGSDVSSSNNPDAHVTTLQTLRRGFARVMASDEIINALEKGE